MQVAGSSEFGTERRTEFDKIESILLRNRRRIAHVLCTRCWHLRLPSRFPSLLELLDRLDGLKRYLPVNKVLGNALVAAGQGDL